MRHIILGSLFSVISFIEGSTLQAHTYINRDFEKDVAHEKLKELEIKSRLSAKKAGFDEFKEGSFKEKFDNGLYIVNGDTPILDEDELKKFFHEEISTELKSPFFGLSLDENSKFILIKRPLSHEEDFIWGDTKKLNISYCVSKGFEGNYSNVVDAMENATKSWEDVSEINFVHKKVNDDNCDENNSDVEFDVRPINVEGHYFARAFFPRFPRKNRNLLIDDSTFQIKRTTLALTGLLRHELGHILSFRHVHTRPESGKCFLDKDWYELSSYIGFSTMVYPQCKGLSDWGFDLNDKDIIGVQCLYGPKTGIAFDQSLCKL